MWNRVWMGDLTALYGTGSSSTCNPNDARRLGAVRHLHELLISEGHTASLNATWAQSIGAYGVGPGQFASPLSVAANTNTVVITDEFTSRVQTFSPNGTFARVGMISELARVKCRCPRGFRSGQLAVSNGRGSNW